MLKGVAGKEGAWVWSLCLVHSLLVGCTFELCQQAGLHTCNACTPSHPNQMSTLHPNALPLQVGSIFEYANKNAVFGVIQPDSPLWAPILGLFALTGLPMAGAAQQQHMVLPSSA